MSLSIPTLFLFNFFLLQISGTTYTDSLSSFNISSDLYIDQEYKFTPNATELTNYTTAYEKRIFSIEFDEQKFCANSYYNVQSTEIVGTSYRTNISSAQFLDMIASVFIETEGILLTLDKFMNLHEFKVDFNKTNSRTYVQMIKPSEFNSGIQYEEAWLYYSKEQDAVIGYCLEFHFFIYLSDILKSNKTSSTLLNCSQNQEDDKNELVNVIQLSSNNSRFLKVYQDFLQFTELQFNDDKTIKFFDRSGKGASSLRDAAVSALTLYTLSGDSTITKYTYSLNNNQIEQTDTFKIPSQLEDATFVVTKIGSSNTKVNDKLFFVGGYQINTDYDNDPYCVIEFFVDGKSLIQNRYYCSDEEILEIQVLDRFAFVRRKSIHQFLYHSIPAELLTNDKTQNYMISQQLMHATLQQGSEFNQYYLIGLQMANQYSVSINFIEENTPKLICLADGSYGENKYGLLYKMKTSHCKNMEISHQNGCKLYQEIKIDLKEYDNNSRTGLIIGIIIGCVVLIVCVTVFLYWFLHRKFAQEYEQLKENYEAEKYNKQQQQYQSPQPVKQDDVQLQL